MNEQFPASDLPNTDAGKTMVDYVIIGQGICGTFLSYYLINAGKKVIVIDDNKPFSASKVASGVINPVTGRRIVRTWMIEDLLPFALNEYSTLGIKLGVDVVKSTSVLDFHPTLQMKEAFEKRLNEETEYLHNEDESLWKNIFDFHFGVGKISPCLLIDINTLLNKWRFFLASKNCLSEATFSFENLSITPELISYRNITANKIIFCDGINGVNNPYFKNLPYSPNKGEAIIAKIPNLNPDLIYKYGLSIVPWKDDLFWVGSTYEWDFKDSVPTEAFRKKVDSFLTYSLKLPFEIVDHIASVRPANMERRPFVGLHPKHVNVGILNGMGTKGCSLAPFFAKELSDFLVHGKSISAEANVRRFEKILERKMN